MENNELYDCPVCGQKCAVKDSNGIIRPCAVCGPHNIDSMFSEDASLNAPCDNSGYCVGLACRNYPKCAGWTKIELIDRLTDETRKWREERK